ncbi:gas vesicle protein GvpO [Streptomyces rugosispiralis]|uniref:Gas vesicle protein n=1 Tax=Streptomyces rugosispiralis TaxID=2967341 RepID=A0ABT1UTR3_9ACTN|nr:gas vesicle protein GvpO [Streptomyces rugosispiralis]MCQ8188406.1 gas vesicle protein [Streptomyces rugosispiralis]
MPRERPREEHHREERPRAAHPGEQRPREERDRREHEPDRRTDEPDRREHEPDRRADEPERERPRPRPRRPALVARDAARSAARQVRGLTGRTPEGVTSLERTEDGWTIGIEVVETHRIPDSTDILAEYRVELDDRGELVSYHRTERYYRGRAENRT